MAQTSYEDEAWVIAMITGELEALKLTINTNKTRIKREKFGMRRILGVNVSQKGLQATRKTLRKIRAVRGHMRFSTTKSSVLGGLRTWSTCAFPKGYKQMFAI